MKNYYVAHDESEAQDVTAELRREGYTRVSNCFWYEHWKKDDNEVTVERDF